MKSIKTLVVGLTIILCSVAALNAGSFWGISFSSGSTCGEVNSSNYYARLDRCSSQQRIVYIKQNREFVNPYMPTVYRPREYYINGQPYMIYPQVHYMR